MFEKLIGLFTGSAFVAGIVVFANQTILIPAWGAFGVLLAAVIPPLINWWDRKSARIAQWKRDDELEERKNKHDKLVASKVAEVATEAENVARRVGQVAEAALETQHTMKKMEKMVDGQQTILMQNELDAKRATLVYMKRNAQLEGDSSEISAEIESYQKRIDELGKAVAERRKLQAQAKPGA